MKLARAGRKFGLDFIRLFGSGTGSIARARDIDIVFGEKKLDAGELSEFQSDLTSLFGKPVDLVHLCSDLPPRLVIEIASTSTALWNAPAGGREKYAVLMDRLQAIAQDEELAFTPEMRKISISIANRRLRVP